MTRARSFLNHRARPLWFLLAFGFVLRLLILLGTNPIMWPDSLTYCGGADRIIERGLFTAQPIYRTPLYPAFLAAFLRFGQTPAMGLAVVAVQHALGLASVLLAYLSIRRVFGPATAFPAAMLLNVHTLLLYYENVIHTEILFVFVLNLAVYGLLRALAAPRVVLWIATGFLFGLVSLTRPVAQLLLLALLPVAWWKFGRFRAAVLRCALAAAVSFATLLPWMLTNRRTYGFLGIAHIQGAQLFHKVFDKARLKPVPDTRYARVQTAMEASLSEQDGRRIRVDWSVFGRLQREQKMTALQADQAMWGFAFETILSDPFRFAGDTFRDFLLMFWSAQRSVCVRNSETGPYLSSMYGKRVQRPAFPRKPVVRFPVVRAGIASFFRRGALPIRALVVLAAAGAIASLAARRKYRPEALAFVIIPVYLAGLTVPFDTYEDRYRLPCDPFIFALAVFAVVAAVRRAVEHASASGKSRSAEFGQDSRMQKRDLRAERAFTDNTKSVSLRAFSRVSRAVPRHLQRGNSLKRPDFGHFLGFSAGTTGPAFV